MEKRTALDRNRSSNFMRLPRRYASGMPAAPGQARDRSEGSVGRYSLAYLASINKYALDADSTKEQQSHPFNPVVEPDGFRIAKLDGLPSETRRRAGCQCSESGHCYLTVPLLLQPSYSHPLFK